MSDLKLGELITGPAHRDAIHVAVAPVTAVVKLYPGQRVALVAGKTDEITVSGEPIGIVDPFLIGPVYPDEKCWLFLFPNTVTGMRHHWRHPAFMHAEVDESVVDDGESMKFIEDLADEYGLTYESFMGYVSDYLHHGSYASQGGRWEGMSLYGNNEFWDHYETVTGVTVSDDDRGGVFSCSC